MNIFGPRPVLRQFPRKLAEKFPFYRFRFSVRPVITNLGSNERGLYRQHIGQLQNLEHELHSIQNRSIFVDLFIIILKTFPAVLFHPGAGE